VEESAHRPLAPRRITPHGAARVTLMNDFAQAPQPPQLHHVRRRRWWLLLLLLLVLAGALVWWWGPWRTLDVRIQFLRFEERWGERTAVFEIANRSAEDLSLSNRSADLIYELLSPDGTRTTIPPRAAGAWPVGRRTFLTGFPVGRVDVQAGASRPAKVSISMPDGTPITAPFRVGIGFTDNSGGRRSAAVERLPGWAKRWLSGVLPNSYFQNRTHVYWSEMVTP
jgi:hypothetical protein